MKWTEVGSQFIAVGDECLQYSHINLYHVMRVCVGFMLRAGTAQVLLIDPAKGSCLMVVLHTHVRVCAQ